MHSVAASDIRSENPLLLIEYGLYVSCQVPKLEEKDNEEERKQEQDRIDTAEPLTEEEMVGCTHR